ncbi:hypothetical protein AXG93_4266s1010 [Marchantia polymorpha subsp. ruderalis]|uniref:Uncharacterized protein n=1 Tax=Marchantia polymorpha subsp. ruderalis TaxID=1480154 RepID=A0A176VV47_MARPO|nr:hypothetical protein AXG93_4266s1010 [Marchantia polymorpha subsp. ruderalis]
MYGAMKSPRRYYGAIGIIELDDFIQEFDTCQGGVSISDVVISGGARSSTSGGIRSGTTGSTDEVVGEGTRSGTSGAASTKNDTSSTAVGKLGGVVSGVPTFSPIAEFFKMLRKNYQRMKT